MTTALAHFQWRRGLAANWTTTNPVLLEGEPGLETDTLQFKVGDGTSAWTALTYAGGVTNHAALAGLNADGAHPQYALAAGMTSALALKADASALSSAVAALTATDATKADSSALASAVSALQATDATKADATALAAHAANVANPHAVTPGQVSSWRSAGTRILAFGDSFVAYQSAGTINSNAYLALAEAMSMGKLRLDFANNKGVAGNTTTALLNRYAADVAANYANFDILYLSGGRNDSGIPATTVANLTSICEQARNAGKLVFLEVPNPPRNTLDDTARVERGRVNRDMERYATSRPGVVFVDFWNDWADPTVDTGNAPAGILQVDNLHPTQAGAMAAARRIVAQVGPLFPVATPRQWGAWDRWNANTNPNGNLLSTLSLPACRLAGTTGTISTATGTVAANWQFSRLSGSGTEMVASKEAGVAGYDSAGTDTQVLTASTQSAFSSWAFRCAAITVDASLVGRAVEVLLDVELTNMVNCYQLQLRCYHNGTAVGTVWGNASVAGEVLVLPNGWMRLRTPPLTITGATNMFLQLQFGLDVGGSGVIKARNPVIHALP